MTPNETRVSNELAELRRAIMDEDEAVRERAVEDVQRILEANARWQSNSVDTWAAMTAMRNAINEYIPMPSIEGDLLQGPENSIFCAEVAKAVVAFAHPLPNPSPSDGEVSDKLMEAAKAVLASADRPGARLCFAADPSEDDVWIPHMEVDQSALDLLTAAIQSSKRGQP